MSTDPTPETAARTITFERHSDSYRHWSLSFDGPTAHLSMRVDPECRSADQMLSLLGCAGARTFAADQSTKM